MSDGILAWVGRRPQAIPPSHFSALVATQAHRGPDGLGERQTGAYRLAQQNFHLSPHSAAGPFEDHGVILLLAGRLDHRERLATALKLPLASTDAELVMAAYRRWDTGWLDHSHGSVAAVIVDVPRQRLLACRDELGKVPLHYHIAPGFLLMASEPAVFLHHEDIGREPDRHWLAYYFSGLATEPGAHTAFAQVQSLLPGQTLLYEENRVRFLSARRRLGQSRLRFPRDADYAEQFRTLLEASIANVTAGHERVGIMLSGGMDSCPAACLTARRFRETGQRLTAYSWTLAGFPEADETAPIRVCAEYAGIEPQLFPADELWSLPTPIAWPVELNSPTANPYLKLFVEIYERAAADGCRLLLQGTFGDSLYPTRWELADAVSDLRLILATRELAGLIRRAGLRDVLQQPEVRRTLRRLVPFRSGKPPQAAAWLTAPAAEALDFDIWPPEAAIHPRPSQFRNVLGAGVFARQIGYARASVERGVARCDPFHDWDLIDFMLAIPAYQSTRLGQRKYLAREGLRGHMPEALRTRPRGSLLGSFYHAGFERSRAAMRDFLTRPHCTWPEYVEQDYVMSALTEPASAGFNRLVPWLALTYELWLEKLKSAFGG